jgi:hypothetical protein
MSTTLENLTISVIQDQGEFQVLCVVASRGHTKVNLPVQMSEERAFC